MKEANLERSHTIGFHLYSTLKVKKLWKWRTDESLPGAMDKDTGEVLKRQ